jgi:hypothetical protein
MYQGDCFMVRNWINLGLAASLATILIATPRTRADAPTSDTGATSTAAQLRQIQQSITSLQAKLDADLNTIRASQLTTDMKADGALRQLLELRQQVADMRREMDALRRRANTVTSTSAYGPTGVPTATTASVRLVNTYPSEQAVMVNGLSYHLAPGETRTLTIPAGSFRYEVLDAQLTPQERTVAPRGTFTITLYPVGS